MGIILCCPTYKRFDLCVQMIASAEQGTLIPDRILILDNGAGKFSDYLKENSIELSDRVTIITAPYNMGVARGWNTLLRIVADMFPDDLAVIVNDDLLLGETALFNLFDAAQRDYISFDGNYALVYCAGGIDAPNAFSFFMVHPKTFFDTIGAFDETIWPAYFDDNDLHYRMKLADYELARIDSVTATHLEGGSATLKSYTYEEEQKHHHQFRRNQEYFVRKWGGLPGEEKYKIAFDGQDIMAHMLQLKERYGF